jgi:hypothetical protein
MSSELVSNNQRLDAGTSKGAKDVVASERCGNILLADASQPIAFAAHQQAGNRIAEPLAVASDMAQPAVAGLTARFAHLALTGQLYVDKGSIARAIAKSDSPVAKQILGTAREMETNDWRFLKAPPNWEYGGKYDNMTRTLWYSTRGWRGEFQYILGAGEGPITEAAVGFSHEVGHHDTNVASYWVEPADSGAYQVMAKRGIIAETRAMLGEVHMDQELGASTEFARERLAALRSGTLGDYISNVSHLNHGGLPDGEANQMVNQYLEKTYGKNVVDPVSGKVRAFDMRAGFGKNQVAPLATDGEYLSWLESEDGHYLNLRQDPSGLFEARNLAIEGQPLRTFMLQKTRFLRAGESSAAGIFGHGTRALAAVGLVFAANDIAGQYRQGAGAGTGRLACVATDWAGYEAGALAGRTAVKALAIYNPWAATAISLGTAIVASDVFDKGLGQRLESAVHRLF